jgi:cytochrome c oxidase cbb3-type subunit III
MSVKSVNERDDYTGHATTGHEWNGIKELNTPVPRAVYAFLLVTFIFSVGYWILMPAWPLGVTYTKGLLGIDQRTTVAAALEKAAHDRSAWTKQIESESFSQIQSNPQLMEVVRQTGPTLFLSNCAACHGRDGKGQKGFPNLTTASFLWGGDPDAIAETIRVGINSAHPDTRTSQMPAFGHDQMLKPDEVDKVVAFVRTLSDPAAAKDAPPARVEAGKEIFTTTCTPCHGDDGKGKTDVGAPNLTDTFWIYGGDPQSILTTVWNGRQGHMPTWESRLSKVDRKILALYVFGKRATAP